jgi:hypothetical protein
MLWKHWNDHVSNGASPNLANDPQENKWRDTFGVQWELGGWRSLRLLSIKVKFVHVTGAYVILKVHVWVGVL